MSSRKRVLSYDTLRVITTLLVVLSHCRYYAMLTPYGGCDYSALVDPGNLSWRIVTFITSFVNTITMPTFMALGGALFWGSMKRGRFPTLGALAKNKAQRLLIPFLVVGFLYTFPIKLATGYFSGSEHPLLDFFLGQVLLQGNTHLWFLPAMFLVFLIIYLVERYVKVSRITKLTVYAALSILIWNFDKVYLVAYTLRNLVWFYAGYCFESQRKESRKRLRLHIGLMGMVLAVILYCCALRMQRLPIVGKVLYLTGIRLIVPATAAGALYAISRSLSRTTVVSSRAFRSLSENSFGIYLYSDPLNYVVLCIGASCFSSFLFANSLGILVLYALRFSITLLCSVLISQLLRWCKMKYIV